MQTRIKRILSLVLAIVLVISIMPANMVFAEGNPDVPATEPEETTAPATEPEETKAPTEPEETKAPTEPEETKAPTEPEETKAPTEPEETTAPTEPEETTEPTEPEETTAPTEPEETKPVCTGLADCAADNHEDTCEKKIADDKAAADKAAADAVSAQIEALPTLEQLRTMPFAEQVPYYTQVQTVYSAYCALTADQQALLPPAEEVFKPYFDYFNTLTAEAASHSHPICGATCTHEETHTNMSASSWTYGTFSSGSYYMGADITLSRDMTITGNAYLCLNGHTLNFVDGYGLHINYGASLTICDCAGNGQIIRGTKLNGGTGIVNNHGSLTIYGGTYCPDGEGWFIYNTGSLTIYDGSFGIGIHNGYDDWSSSTTRYGNVVIYHADITYVTDVSNVRMLDNSKGCSMTIYDGSFTTSLGLLLRNQGKADIRGGKFQNINTSASDTILNEGTLSIRNAVVTTKAGRAIHNVSYRNYSSGSSTFSTLRIYNGAVITSDSTYQPAIRNCCNLYVYGGTISGYMGIENGSETGGTDKNGGSCSVSGGNISGTKCAILNSGNTSTMYENGVPSTKKFSRGILEISDKPSLGKIILAYPEALTINYRGSAIINIELDMTDIVLGDTICTGNLPVLNLLNDGYVLLYDYYKGIYLETNHCGATSSDDLRWKITPDGKLTIFGTGKMYNYPVSSHQPWNKSKTRVEIKEVILEPGITHIGNSAFAYIDGLTKIVIPEGVTTIGTWVFEGSNNLEEVHLPSTLTSIGRCFFATQSGTEPPAAVYYNGCEHQWAKVQVESTQPAPVKPICIPNENTDDGDCTTALSCSVCNEEVAPEEGTHTGGTATCKDQAICIRCGKAYGKLRDHSSESQYDCEICGLAGGYCAPNGLKDVAWVLDKNGVLTISGTGKMADYSAGGPWRSCGDRVRTVVIEDGVSTVGNSAFYDTRSITAVTFGKDVTAIGYGAFRACLSLESIRIPDHVTSIGEFAFYGCTSLATVELPAGITGIGYATFRDCKNLTSVNIPDSVTTIGGCAFYDCVNLTTVTIPASVSQIDDNAFGYNNSSNAKTIIFQGTAPAIGSEAFHNITATAYYPANDASWTTEVMQNYGGDITWVCISCKDGHTEATVTGTPATCTQGGMSDGKYCSVCKEVLVKQEPIAALNHTGGTATCKDKAVCTRCSASHGELNAENHAGGTELRGGKEATCTADGYTGDTYCLGCDEKIADGKAITAPGHDMGEWTATETEGEERRDCSLCDHYETRTVQPDHVLKLEDEDLKNQSVVYINGLPYPVKGDSENRYVEFESEEDCMMVTYTYHVADAADVHTQYPTGMKVYRISGSKVTYIPELDNLLQYSGSSIRITGKKGIRMITSLYRSTKAALTGGGLAGYKLLEYGTALCWASEIASGDALVLGRPFTRSNYAYKKGVADPVFANTGNLTQYTNVLVGFTNEQCKDDIAMRSYIIVEDAAGKQFTLYGGAVYRSVGYIAYQNRNAFTVGSGAYNYVWEIIHPVYGDRYDADYKG